ncbi:MAG: TolC family protein [Burkholderiales bacterium]|nr:TolC family protein [Burkholderiales bacterium]
MRAFNLASPLLAACMIIFGPSAHAQATLRDAFEAAWRRQPQAQAAAARDEEFTARGKAAQAFLPGPPALGLEHWTDGVTRNDGMRKYAGEMSVPLWLPGQKERAQAVIGAERVAYDGALALARLRLAGEVRESYWNARAAAAEVALAEATLQNLLALESDVARRFRAGDLARIDGNRALAEVQMQRLTLADTRARAERAWGVFGALTGLPRMPDGNEAPAEMPARALADVDRTSAGSARAARANLRDDHPALRAAAQAVASLRARLEQVRGDDRDAPEIGVGTIRERSEFGRPWEQIVTFRLRVPFGNENRNRPRLAAVNVELMEAQAAQAVVAAQMATEAASAERELVAAEAALPLAESRSALARDTRELVERGFRLGEFDLVTRLRAEREHAEADLARARAVLEAGRANARLKQALGILP